MSAVIRQNKRLTLLELLEQGVVMLHLDPRRAGVIVPAAYRTEAVIRLNIGYGFNLPALEIDDDGVFAILSFHGENIACTLPWDAIFAMTIPGEAESGRIWSRSRPAERERAAPRSLPNKAPTPRSSVGPGSGPAREPTNPAPAPRRPHLQVVEGDGAMSGEGASGTPAPRRPRPILTVVKS